jgi:hypothetical protein
MSRTSWGLVGGAAEGRLGAGGGVLLLRELVALSVLVARELLVLLENQYLCNVRVSGREKHATHHSLAEAFHLALGSAPGEWMADTSQCLCKGTSGLPCAHSSGYTSS